MPSPSFRRALILPVVLVLAACGGRFTWRSEQAAPQHFVLPGGVALDLVGIPAGAFPMGSPDDEEDRFTDEGPQHPVTLSRSYHLGRTEVTQEQWLAVMGTRPSGFTGTGLPVERVSWEDIAGSGGFLERLNALTAATRTGGRVFRLPTEAEWQWAARAGGRSRFPWGQDPGYAALGGYAWWRGNADAGAGRRTHPVALKAPNAWGLYDMAGNVAEWCQDRYGAYTAAPQRDPQGPGSGAYRVVAGGSWDGEAASCRSACRDLLPPANRVDAVGFRVVLAVP